MDACRYYQGIFALCSLKSLVSHFFSGCTDVENRNCDARSFLTTKCALPMVATRALKFRALKIDITRLCHTICEGGKGCSYVCAGYVCLFCRCALIASPIAFRRHTEILQREFDNHFCSVQTEKVF